MTGCDTVEYLWGIGKGTVVNDLLSGMPLAKLGTDDNMDEIVGECADFLARCYNSWCDVTGDMSSVRYKVWATKMSNPGRCAAPKLKTLPPTTQAFQEHVYRAHFQTALWRAALHTHPPPLEAVHYGWKRDEASRTLLPIPVSPDESPAPLYILELIMCSCSSDRPCATARCGCASASYHVQCFVGAMLP